MGLILKPLAQNLNQRLDVWRVGALTGACRANFYKAFVPTLNLSEFFADKVYALGARDRIKPRDIDELWWLCEKGAVAPTADAP